MINIPYYTVFDLAYCATYRKPPPGNIRLTSPPDVIRKDFNGLIVDDVLKDEWLEILCSIDNPNVKIISISAGHNRSYLTHIIFVLLNTSIKRAEEYVEKYHSQKYINATIMYLENTPIYLAVSTKTWYRYGTIQDNNSKWRDWWEAVVEITNSTFDGK